MRVPIGYRVSATRERLETLTLINGLGYNETYQAAYLSSTTTLASRPNRWTSPRISKPHRSRALAHTKPTIEDGEARDIALTLSTLLRTFQEATEPKESIMSLVLVFTKEES
jgi:hypothetical protein